MGLFKGMKGALERMDDRRRAPRITDPPMHAYFWNGAAPIALRLGDISRTGAYIYTPERWYLGTIVQTTFDADPTERASNGPDPSISTVTVWSKIVRHGSDGVAMDFVIVKRTQREKLDALLATVRSLSQEKTNAEAK